MQFKVPDNGTQSKLPPTDLISDLERVQFEDSTVTSKNLLASFDVFIAYIIGFGHISSEELDVMRSLCIEKKLKRRQYLQREGDHCRHLTLICSGCLRSFRLSQNGEHVLEFYPEGTWVADYNSLYGGRSSSLYIDAVEETCMLQWSLPSVEQMQGDIPLFRQIHVDLMRQNIDDYKDRIFSLISCSAEQRFNLFIEKFPQLINRVPLYMIASHLGLTRETLTRLRRQS
jgi:CRP-like cAMP-binding protein